MRSRTWLPAVVVLTLAGGTAHAQRSRVSRPSSGRVSSPRTSSRTTFQSDPRAFGQTAGSSATRGTGIPGNVNGQMTFFQPATGFQFVPGQGFVPVQGFVPIQGFVPGQSFFPGNGTAAAPQYVPFFNPQYPGGVGPGATGMAGAAGMGRAGVGTRGAPGVRNGTGGIGAPRTDDDRAAQAAERDAGRVQVVLKAENLMEERPFRSGMVTQVRSGAIDVSYRVNGQARTEAFVPGEVFFFGKDGELATAANAPNALRPGDRVLVPEKDNEQPRSGVAGSREESSHQGHGAVGNEPATQNSQSVRPAPSHQKTRQSTSTRRRAPSRRSRR